MSSEDLRTLWLRTCCCCLLSERPSDASGASDRSSSSYKLREPLQLAMQRQLADHPRVAMAVRRYPEHFTPQRLAQLASEPMPQPEMCRTSKLSGSEDGRVVLLAPARGARQ